MLYRRDRVRSLALVSRGRDQETSRCERSRRDLFVDVWIRITGRHRRAERYRDDGTVVADCPVDARENVTVRPVGVVVENSRNVEVGAKSNAIPRPPGGSLRTARNSRAEGSMTVIVIHRQPRDE